MASKSELTIVFNKNFGKIYNIFTSIIVVLLTDNLRQLWKLKRCFTNRRMLLFN